MAQAQRIDGAGSFPLELGETLVVIGNFDGVHLGHRTVIERAVAEAEARKLTPVVLTFDPHPAEVLRRGPVSELTSLERKVELLTRISSTLRVVVEPFSLELAGKSPEAFARELLTQALRAKVVMVGENFRFGQGRAGNFAALLALGQRLGFETLAVGMVGDEQGLYSSTRVRTALARGDLVEVERLLGRPHALTGVVERGAGRGRSLGVPTANLGSVREALPPHGVYACLLDRREAQGRFVLVGKGVANLGLRPTVAAGFSIEVHLLDFAGDLYAETLRIYLCARLRDERRFPGLSELARQIADDILQARQLLAKRSPKAEAGGAWY